MSAKAKRASWIIGLLTLLVTAGGLVGTAAGHWSDTQSRIGKLEVKDAEQDARMSRSEEAIQYALAEIKQDVGKIRDHLMERD